jgi:hypothetical protein
VAHTKGFTAICDLVLPTPAKPNHDGKMMTIYLFRYFPELPDFAENSPEMISGSSTFTQQGSQVQIHSHLPGTIFHLRYVTVHLEQRKP